MNVRKATLATLLIGLLTAGLAPAAWAADSIPVEFPAGSLPTVENLRCEYLENPLGIDVLKPRLSWITESKRRGWLQSAYQILVASSEEKLIQDEGDLWDSGKVPSDRSIHVVYEGEPLTSRMRCFWKVRVWDERGDASTWSRPAMWTMGLLEPEEWNNSQWIGLEPSKKAKKRDERLLSELPEGKTHTIDRIAKASGQLPARYLRRDFRLEKPVRQATVYLCGLGEFELYLNGRKVGDHERDPGVSEFKRRVFYITFDVDEYLSSGQNAVGIILGNGRYVVPAHRYAALGYPKLIFHMRIEYVDGTTQDLNSDDQWSITDDGPIRGNDEYHGEQYDARKEMPGWNRTGFDASRWEKAQLLTPPGGELQARMYEPFRVTETFQPEKITNPDPGVYIVNFEKGFYGTVRLKMSGPAGTKVTLRSTFSLYPDGRLNLRNQVGGKTTDSYVLKGQGTEVWRPRFRGQGTRYVEVTGFPGTPTLENFEGLFMHDDVEETGSFECSNDQLNKLHRMMRFDQLGQKHSHPMELERIERQGWLGGSGTYSEAESAHLNVAAFYSKWLGDIRLDQRPDGALCDVSPRQGWGKYSGSVTWPADIVLIPQVLYKYYGDRRVLEENYDVMKKWVLNIQRRQDKSTLIVEGDDRYGDWVDAATIGISPKEWPKGRLTSISLINTAYMYNHFKQLAAIAHTLGKPDDQAKFEACAGRTAKAFNQEFFDPQTNRYESESQCSYVLPLAFGLVPPDRREAVISNLVHDIMVTHDRHVSVGLIGMAWMMRTLSDIGRDDVAYALATQATRPSWGYMLAKDASGMWEYWDGEDRSNGTTGFSSGQGFLMLAGDLNAWIYHSLAGINPDPQQPGFKHIVLKPQPVGDLTYVNASYKSMHGRIVSNWKRENEAFKWQVAVPANTTATVHVPAKDAGSVRESGKPAGKSDHVRFIRMQNGRAVFEVGSGNYEFDSTIR